MLDHHRDIKTAVLEGDTIEKQGWSIHINANDEVEIWPSKGAGFSTGLSNLDKAVSDFCKKAEIILQSINVQNL